MRGTIGFELDRHRNWSAIDAVLTILIDGLTYASWLFIVALGLTLVFGVLKILNIAHGSFYALGAYAAASFVGWAASMKWAPAYSLVAMLLAAVAVAAVVAPLTERGAAALLLRPRRSAAGAGHLRACS